MKHLATGLTLSATALLADDKPLDFWDEELRLFAVAAPDQHVDATLAERRLIAYRPQGFELDHADHVEGDLSILYTPSKAGMPSRFGFVAGLWGESWKLSPAMYLRLWIKVQDAAAADAWVIRLVDRAGLESTGELSGTDTEGTWKELTLPLDELQTPAGFDWQQVALCEFDVDFGAEARIHLDGIRFAEVDALIGITDKPLAQRLTEAEANRAARIADAFDHSAQHDDAPVVRAFAKMYLGEDLDTANQLLMEELAKSTDGNAWSLLHTPLYCRFYYLFSSKYGQFPGRLSPEAEAQLMATLWERTAAKNDIHWARQSTWWLDGSENHDLNAKASNLVTSRIFMHEPDYKDRVFPDFGFGGGYHYGHAGYYGPGIDPASRHGGGRANLADGKQYNARDHYQAWLAFLKTYFRQRAQRGFFVEYGSHSYSKHTLNMVDLAYQYGGDGELHKLIGDFLTLYWAEWAQVSISGERGGPKTRHHKTPVEGDGTSHLISFHLGGPANAGIWWYWNLINDYRLPPVVWRMVLDRIGMGNYTYAARGVGEEENAWPRPLGTERTLTVDTEARFLKTTYVTPDYTLGTQMDHPTAIHSHLSLTGRWHGMTFAQSATSRIVPVGLVSPDNPHNHLANADKGFDLELVLQTAQHRQTLIVQQARRWTAVHPEWFPTHPSYSRPMGIWLGTDWDEQTESNGWIFVWKGRAYAAIRPVLWDAAYEQERQTRTAGNQVYFNAPDDPSQVKLREDSYSWNEGRSILILEDAHSPVIIEAGHRDDYSTLADFIEAVLDNPIALYKTVVPGYNILVYTGSAADAAEIAFNAGVPQIPTIDGKPVNYSYPLTFDSPYLQS
ncbi:MAG: hypothetical protein QGH25_10595, partial [Candidatus Latescibacteria bacterium]|nr:hypothetical protein [Candidatus Latescibacterota bacterium]